MIKFSSERASLKVGCVLLIVSFLVIAFIDIVPVRVFFVLFSLSIVFTLLFKPRADLVIENAYFSVTTGARIFGYKEENYQLSEISHIRFHNERRQVGMGYPVNSGFEICYKGKIVNVPVTGLVRDGKLLEFMKNYPHIKIIDDVKLFI